MYKVFREVRTIVVVRLVKNLNLEKIYIVEVHNEENQCFDVFKFAFSHDSTY
ncbi:UNVERIFIED_CONTAM: hypothetical protein ABIC26_000298 [Paenibacillus sp. PvR008]